MNDSPLIVKPVMIPNDAGTFSLQVAAFTIRANAYRYADELKKRFGTTDVQEGENRENILPGQVGTIHLTDFSPDGPSAV